MYRNELSNICQDLAHLNRPIFITVQFFVKIETIGKDEIILPRFLKNPYTVHWLTDIHTNKQKKLGKSIQNRTFLRTMFSINCIVATELLY